MILTGQHRMQAAEYIGFHVAEFEDLLSISCPDGDDCESCGEACEGCGATWRFVCIFWGSPSHGRTCRSDCPVVEDDRMRLELLRVSSGIIRVRNLEMYEYRDFTW